MCTYIVKINVITLIKNNYETTGLLIISLKKH